MTLSQLDAEQPRVAEQSSIFEEEEEESKRSSPPPSSGIQSKRNPPARNTSRFWFERFLAVIQRQNPSVIDASFLSQIAPSNEGKLLAQLKFLGVIDEQGKPTKVLPMLNMVGEEQKKAFRQISSEAYRELEIEVKMDKAVPDDVVNFFIRRYSFTRDKAINASKFYLYLAEKSGTAVSSELSVFLTEKTAAPTLTNGSGSIPGTSSRTLERSPVRSMIRDQKAVAVNTSSRHQRRIRATELRSSDSAPIQAIINIKLEKDTPREYWDRVLALLGEKSPTELSPSESSDQVSRTTASSGGADTELEPDSGFT